MITNPKIHIEAFICGISAIFLGLTVIVGWIFGNSTLIQILPTFVPMQFNTALGFVLSGSVILLNYYKPNISKFFAVLLCVIGLLTIFEYLFLVNLHIDEVFLDHYITTYTSHPGRMSPNTALCFSLTGIAYLCKSRKELLIQAVATSCILITSTLGLLSILGYILNLRFIFGWGQLTGMAFHTATGFLIIGIGSYRAFANQFVKSKFSQSLLFPIYVFSGGIILFLISWQGLISAQDNQIKQDMQKDVKYLSKEITVSVTLRLDAIKRIFNRIMLEKNQANLLKKDISAYFNDFHSLITIVTDSGLPEEIIYQTPSITQEKGELALTECQSQLPKTNQKDTLDAILTPNFLCIYESRQHNLAIYNRDFINRTIQAPLFQKYVFYLKDLANTEKANLQSNTSPWQAENIFDITNDKWLLTLILDEDDIRNSTSQALFLYLLMGLLFSSLLAIAIRVWQISKTRNISLIEANNQFDAVISNSPYAVFIFKPDQSIAFTNKQASHLTGYTQEEILTKTVRNFIPPAKVPQHKQYFKDYFSQPTARTVGIIENIQLINKTGKPIPVEIALIPIQIKQNNYVLATVIDISERKAIEKMKSEFVSTVSHELRTPLTAISGSLDLVLGEALGAIPNNLKPMLEIANRNCTQLSLIINDLLDFEKLHLNKMPFHYEELCILPIIEESIDSLKTYSLEKNIELKQSVNINPQVKVRVDKQRLQQVLFNLISNAIKFSRQDSSVLIEIIILDTKIKINIKDTGIGIADSFKKNIFQKFAQENNGNERSKNGTGLGLAISKEIIEQMGGDIGFESNIGKGSTFYFTLPVSNTPL